jgi:hypothetical protein
MEGECYEFVTRTVFRTFRFIFRRLERGYHRFQMESRKVPEYKRVAEAAHSVHPPWSQEPRPLNGILPVRDLVTGALQEVFRARFREPEPIYANFWARHLGPNAPNGILWARHLEPSPPHDILRAGYPVPGPPNGFLRARFLESDVPKDSPRARLKNSVRQTAVHGFNFLG